MNRRRLLKLGMLAAAGGSISLGSGAFTSATASRKVSIAITDDDDAYLSLDPDSEHIRATVATNELEFYIPGLGPETGDGGGPPEGEGVGRNSSYTFGSLLVIRNQGDDPIEVFSDAPNLPPEFDEIALVDSDRDVLLDDETDATELTPGEEFSAGLFIAVDDAEVQKTYDLSMTIIADPVTESVSDKPWTPNGD
jgi:hypothetical protein